MLRVTLAFAVLLGTAPVAAQVAVLDEGTFTHSIAGTRVGREDFSVRFVRGGGIVSYVAQANVLAGEQRRTFALNTDSAGAPTRFQLEVRDATVIVSTVVGERDRSTWLSRVVAGPRESGREVRLEPRTFVAEPGVVHHLWFLLRFTQGQPAVLLTPSANAQDRVVLVGLEPDSVQLGSRLLSARRWELRSAADGSMRWEFWADGAGRLLRARHPASGLEALRDDPPGETPGR
jgi:hypothetical protein